MRAILIIVGLALSCAAAAQSDTCRYTTTGWRQITYCAPLAARPVLTDIYIVGLDTLRHREPITPTRGNYMWIELEKIPGNSGCRVHVWKKLVLCR